MFHNFFQPGKDAERDRRTRQLDLKARRADERLKRHSEEFSTKKVVRVADSVYVAIGYGLANCIMIEGKKILFFFAIPYQNHSTVLYVHPAWSL